MTEKTKAEIEKELEDVNAKLAAEKEKTAKPVPEIAEKVQTVVLTNLPQVETRVGYINDGKDEAKIITIEEATTEMYNDIKLIKAAIVNS